MISESEYLAKAAGGAMCMDPLERSTNESEVTMSVAVLEPDKAPRLRVVCKSISAFAARFTLRESLRSRDPAASGRARSLHAPRSVRAVHVHSRRAEALKTDALQEACVLGDHLLTTLTPQLADFEID